MSTSDASCHQGLDCVTCLSPLDMMQLASGEDDSTGHRIWMGAIFFLYAIDTLIDRGFFEGTKNKTASSDDSVPCQQYDDDDDLVVQVVELGCGTGISGIALLKTMNQKYAFNHPDGKEQHSVGHSDETRERQRPCHIHVTFTDADPAILDLCRRNCQSNIADSCHRDNHTSYTVQHLVWSEQIDRPMHTIGPDENSLAATSSIPTLPSVTNVVLATDVLYDLSSLRPLLATTSRLLSSSGYFILSHVPRADDTVVFHNEIASENDKENEDETANDSEPGNTTGAPFKLHSSLEHFIVEQAKEFQLTLQLLLRPADLALRHDHEDVWTSVMRHDKDKMLVDLEEMEDAGVGIFVFVKQPH